MITPNMSGEEIVAQIEKDKKWIENKLSKLKRQDVKSDELAYEEIVSPNHNRYILVVFKDQFNKNKKIGLFVCKAYTGKNAYDYILYRKKEGKGVIIVLTAHAIKRIKERLGIQYMEAADVNAMVALCFLEPGEYPMAMVANNNDLFDAFLSAFKDSSDEMTYIVACHKGCLITKVEPCRVTVKTFIDNTMAIDDKNRNRLPFMLIYMAYVLNNKRYYSKEYITGMEKGLEKLGGKENLSMCFQFDIAPCSGPKKDFWDF